MAITITGEAMTSDLTRHTARWSAHAAADGGGAELSPKGPRRPDLFP